MQKLGVPYPAGYDKIANADLMIQAGEITNSLRKDSIHVKADREIIAVIAYLQRMGTDITKTKTIAQNK
jgi:cytochrome c oxidase cbb3-type subunit I/II